MFLQESNRLREKLFDSITARAPPAGKVELDAIYFARVRKAVPSVDEAVQAGEVDGLAVVSSVVDLQYHPVATRVSQRFNRSQDSWRLWRCPLHGSSAACPAGRSAPVSTR